MTWENYLQEFDTILNAETPTGLYAEEGMLHYTKLNEARQNRWLKKAELMPELVSYLQNIQEPQSWVVITEPWCGDASHIVPIFHLLSEVSDKISIDYQLRDSGSEIDKYLFNGGKAIPIFIVRDEAGKDIFHWGPRPAPTQAMFLSMKNDNATMDDMKIALQQWYNADKAVTLQKELLEQFQNVGKG